MKNIMTEIEYHTELQLRIDWSELDYFGHVNNVSFFKYIQASRFNYFDKIGLTKLHKETNIGPILASCKCDFKRPLFYPGQVLIKAKVEFLKNSSFSVFHLIIDNENQIVAEAQDIIVLFDFNKNKKALIPIELQKKIEKIERILFNQ